MQTARVSNKVVLASVFGALWYVFSFTTLFLNKYILSYRHVDPGFLAVSQVSLRSNTAQDYGILDVSEKFKRWIYGSVLEHFRV